MSSTEFEIVVPKGKMKERLDVFLTHHVENATRSKVQQAIKKGYVLVNGIAVKPSHVVTGGEVIKVHLPQSAAQDVTAEDIPLDIVYEDDFLIVINKPAGMVTHPAYGNYSGTLVNALLHHSQHHLSNVQTVIANDGFPRPGIVHRLDKDTSGLMVIAKDDATHAHLAKQFERRTIEREYWAIVWGKFEQSGIEHSGAIIEAPVGRSKSDRKKFTVTDAGKHALTQYWVLEEFEYLSLVRCKLWTGRTHQIRVHMHHIGHPVFGDATYGGRKISWGGIDKKKKEEVQHLFEILQRQALHAKTIGFLHPATNEQMKFDSPLPKDFEETLQILRHQ
jgi:23S rRNA pseudouridine1911/1915/1917 synthase